MQRYPVDDAPISIAGLGEHVWATGDGYLLRIDVTTGETATITTSVRAGSGSLGAARNALWHADWRGGMVYRLDPASGAVTGSVAVSRPVGVVATDDVIWVGSEGASGLTRIDPTSLELLGAIDIRGNFAVGAGSVWFAQRDRNRVLRLDAETATEEASITYPPAAQPDPSKGAGGCFVGGELPDAWWTWCFLERGASTPVRIDPQTNAASGWVSVGGSVSGGVLVIDGVSWFVLNDALVAVDGADHVKRIVRLGEGFGADNAIVFAGALWIPNEMAREVVRIDLAALR